MPSPALSPTGPAPAWPPLRTARWRALGTDCSLQYTCADDRTAEAFVRAVQTWVETFEARYSRFRLTSLVSQINAAAGGRWIDIDEEMERFLDLCGTLHNLSRGLLDVTALPLIRLWNYQSATPRVPAESEIAAARALTGWPRVERAPGRVRLPQAGMALDFGGWGKEYAVDMAASIARAHGLATAMIDFGHDLYALGSAPGKPAWHVGLEDPAQTDGTCWSSLAIKDRGVASSGDYRRGYIINGVRYGHIIDPRTGRPVAHGSRQVNIVAPTCLQAGVLATTAFILPPAEAVRFISESADSEGCILTPDAQHQTPGFHQYVVRR
jgi:FAD:protein FMN transferase